MFYKPEVFEKGQDICLLGTWEEKDLERRKRNNLKDKVDDTEGG